MIEKESFFGWKKETFLKSFGEELKKRKKSRIKPPIGREHPELIAAESEENSFLPKKKKNNKRRKTGLLYS